MELPPPVDLGGTWRVAGADEELRREFCSPDYDDRGGRWHDMAVPSHWRSTPAFADSDGPLLYRRRFDTDRPGRDTRAWLCLDGLFYQGDVWLDGDYVGDTEGYFVRRGFEVTEALRARTEHVLGAEVACTPESDLTAKHNVTGVFQHWDCLDPTWNPGGIWRPVRIELTGPVRVRYLRVLCTSAGTDRAVVSIRAQFDSDGFRQVGVRTSLAGVEEVVDHTLAEGANLLEWTVTVADPPLWWPHALGDAPLHLLRIEVDVEGQTSHAVERRIGLRSLRWRDWTLSVNGERLFLKGANHGPTRMALGEATAEELRGDVTLAREAGLDLLRLHAHISRPELYQAADEQGMLIWQDFPLQWGYAHSVRARAVHQAHVAVEALSHHPSVALWCAHNEPLAINPRFDERGSRGDVIRVLARFAAKQALPNWNKTILDRSVKRALVDNDGTRPVISHSGTLPRPGSGGGDTHLYFGWYHGDERDFPGLCRAFPRLARFVSEFGAQAVPDNAEFCQPERWPDLDWARLGRIHNLQKGRFDRYVPPADFASFDDWRHATQAYQANLVKHHVETLRRLKYRPTGGFCQFSLGDGHPGVTWAVLDHLRAPKAGYHALAEACRPVIVVAERPPVTVVPGDALALDVHVVSDLRVPLREVTVEARLSWQGGEHRWSWQGDVGADDCVRVGTAQFVVPETAGPLVLGLTLTADEVTATNRYQATIAAPEPVNRRRTSGSPTN